VAGRGAGANLQQKCRLGVKNWLVVCRHTAVPFPLALHLRRLAVRVTDSALGVGRPLCVTAGRARVTPDWDLASGAGGAVTEPGVSSA
jgi:hypothetical protein